MPGHSVCHYHGARGGAPTGNLNGLVAQKLEKEADAAIQAHIVRNCLRDLKATKSARERGIVPLKTTPAEWASALVRRMEEESEAMKKRKPRGRPKKDTDPTAKAQDTPA